MIIVGFVLLAAAAVAAVALIAQNTATVTVHVFNWSWDTELRWLVVAGLALTAIGLLGLVMMRTGGAHYMRLRGERKALRAENRRLAEQARAAGRAPGYPPGAAAPATPVPPPAGRTDAGPPAPTDNLTTAAPAAPPAGGIVPQERPVPTSAAPHGIRERMAATRQRRRVKG
jgi:uncharacterized integral membrane protein